MKFGFIPAEGGNLYQDSLEQVELGELLGFDSVWIEEHHGTKDHYWPSPIMALAGYATRTSKITLGTNIAILPLYNPVRIAEEVAFLDVISRGRLTFGVAIGYRPEEFSMLGVDMQRRGHRFSEALKLIKRLWQEEQVCFEGETYKISGVTVSPRPISQPHPPIWIGGWGPLALKRAAQLGDAWVPGPTADLEKLLACRNIYHQHLISGGVDPAAIEAPLTRDVIIAGTDKEAWELAERHLLIAYRDEYAAGWGHPLIGGTSLSHIEKFRAFGERRFIIGSPGTCRELIQMYQESFGMRHLICRLYFPGLPNEFILKELHMLADEVIPAFRS